MAKKHGSIVGLDKILESINKSVSYETSIQYVAFC